ncbi:ricin-type beta-trefoil lectin domain protein [Lysobacter firmicutimachus]|uniref:Ricin-type beta-trefoil lectin domain protein n=1 Tax=Lysobacter firmicutimachus TaxID=1792846 RepID=A0AAU8MZG7_9GAMM
MNPLLSIRRWGGAMLLAVLLPLHALADVPGGHVYYSFDPSVSGLDSVDFETTLESDPGPRANVFWSNHFWLSYPQIGGYTGVQRLAGTNGYFLLSVWGATAAKTGSQGTVCGAFDEYGKGYSCWSQREFKRNHPYHFRVAHEGGGWFGVTVTDLTDGASFKLGSVLTAATQISTLRMNSFTEYFEFNWPTESNCYNQPYSRAKFAYPVGNQGAVVASVKSFDMPKCYEYGGTPQSRIQVTPEGIINEYAIGNSPRGQVPHSSGLCLDAYTYTNGVRPILSGCHGLDNQAWVYGVDKTLRTRSNLCLDAYNGGTAPGTPIYVYTCHGGVNQQWDRVGSELRNAKSGLCLRAAGTGSDWQLSLQRCEQGWSVPAPTP